MYTGEFFCLYSAYSRAKSFETNSGENVHKLQEQEDAKEKRKADRQPRREAKKLRVGDEPLRYTRQKPALRRNEKPWLKMMKNCSNKDSQEDGYDEEGHAEAMMRWDEAMEARPVENEDPADACKPEEAKDSE